MHSMAQNNFNSKFGKTMQFHWWQDVNHNWIFERKNIKNNNYVHKCKTLSGRISVSKRITDHTGLTSVQRHDAIAGAAHLLLTVGTTPTPSMPKRITYTDNTEDLKFSSTKTKHNHILALYLIFVFCSQKLHQRRFRLDINLFLFSPLNEWWGTGRVAQGGGSYCLRKWSEGVWMWHFGIWFRGDYGGARLMVRLTRSQKSLPILLILWSLSFDTFFPTQITLSYSRSKTLKTSPFPLLWFFTS